MGKRDVQFDMLIHTMKQRPCIENIRKYKDEVRKMRVS